jgi:hypothetical protein
LNAKPELQWQILNKNISQNFSLSVLFLYQKFCKNLNFPRVSIVNEAPGFLNANKRLDHFVQFSYGKNGPVNKLTNLFHQNARAEIHQALQTQFSLLAEFLIGKVLVKDRDSRVLELVNLNPGDGGGGGWIDSFVIGSTFLQTKKSC